MKWLFLFLTIYNLGAIAFAQEPSLGIPAKHPRVMELEDKLTEEASLYFSRRYPNEPFFFKIDVTPLRRNFSNSATSDALPYYDQETEEMVDEWDDPTTPLSYLRNRVIKINVEASIPNHFDDLKISEIKQELPIYLKLLPSRDEIRVEKKFQKIKEKTPNYVFYILGSLFVSAMIIGLMFRWSIAKMKPQASGDNTNPVPTAGIAGMGISQPQNRPTSGKMSTAVSGDVTFHDPIKTMDIVQIKLKHIDESKTFPLLRDLMLMNELGLKEPSKLGAIICELPSEWQKTLFKMGKGQHWLEAFSNPGQIDHECLMLLDQLSRQRQFIAGDRNWENLLIQLWRLGDKSSVFIKKINQDHAFLILSMFPKSLSLGIAKKCFPGGWGKLLESNPQNIVIDSKVINDYLNQAYEITPSLGWKMLEEYKKDKEILSYLDTVSIDDERDIYETLNKESFIFSVRPPFYKVFELESVELHKVIHSFPLDYWAMAVVNSSRQYIRNINDQLDDKRKIIFSSHLKHFDHNHPEARMQGDCRQQIARFVEQKYGKTDDQITSQQVTEDNPNEKIA